PPNPAVARDLAHGVRRGPSRPATACRGGSRVAQPQKQPCGSSLTKLRGLRNLRSGRTRAEKSPVRRRGLEPPPALPPTTPRPCEKGPYAPPPRRPQTTPKRRKAR